MAAAFELHCKDMSIKRNVFCIFFFFFISIYFSFHQCFEHRILQHLWLSFHSLQYVFHFSFVLCVLVFNNINDGDASVFASIVAFHCDENLKFRWNRIYIGKAKRWRWQENHTCFISLNLLLIFFHLQIRHEEEYSI